MTTLPYCLKFQTTGIRKGNPDKVTGLLEFRDKVQRLERPRQLEFTGHSSRQKTAAQIEEERAPQTCKWFPLKQRKTFTVYSKALDIFLSNLVSQGCLRSEASIDLGSTVECREGLHLNMTLLEFIAEAERIGLPSTFPTKSYFPLPKQYSTAHMIV